MPIYKYTLTEHGLTYLHVPAGCLTAIQAKEEHSKLLVLADYAMGEIRDESRFDISYFNGINK